VGDMNLVTIAQKAHDAAAMHYSEACAEYEAAAMSHQQDLRSRAEEQLQRASQEYARTMADLVAARRAATPSFEDLLRDPTFQSDPQSAVLASILAYSQAAPASAGLPVGTAPTFGHRQFEFPLIVNPVRSVAGLVVVRSDTPSSLTAA
jgi:hypothetical protein